jgi:signal transduction histidine kinase
VSASIAAALTALGGLSVALGAGLVTFVRRYRRALARQADLSARLETVRRRQATAPLGRLEIRAQATRWTGLASPRLQAMLGLATETVDLDTLTGCFDSAASARLADLCVDVERAAVASGITVGPSTAGQWFAVYGQPGETAEVLADPVLWFADITEEVQARQRAIEERRRHEAVVEALPLPVWFRGPDLAVADGNTAYVHAVGVRRAAIGEEAPELLGASRCQASRDLATRALSRGAMAAERHHAVVEGSRRLLEIMELPIGDGRTLGLAIDRTQEEELEARLNRHIAAHADVLESLSTAIVVFGPDLRVRFYNGAYADLWDLPTAFLDSEPHATEILDKLREKRALPEQSDFPAFKRAHVEKLRNLVKSEEELIHRPDDRTFKMTRAPHPFGGVLITFEDVTDRLTLERNFNTLIAVQRETIENLHEAVAVFGPDGRLTLHNQVFLSLWGLDNAALGEQPHLRDVVEAARDRFDVSDPARWPTLKERLVARATEPAARRGRLELADRTVLDWAQVPLPDGQSLFTYLDVTDSIRVERALRERAEALETADQLKSEFIANISYELRTPLNAIVGFSQMLESEFYGALNDRQREYARSITESSQRLTGLINDVLDLATIEAGYMELEREPLRMDDLLNSVRAIAFERARHRGLTLEIECPDPDAEFLADPRRIRQALYNLMSNAFNFTPEGGRVILRGERVGDEVHISVSDTGVGIPEQEQDRLFQKFERGDNRSGGPGLGLSLVSSLVQLHGGRVIMNSKPQEGTRVICALPVTPAVEGTPAEAA